MLLNPKVGQRVRVMEEFRDDWPVHDLADLTGIIAGLGNWPVVRFRGRDDTIHVPHRFLEAIETEKNNG